jgi:hypothetical protein
MMRIVLAVGLALLLAFPLGSLFLHCGQVRHNELPFSVEQAYPEDDDFVPGAPFADTLAALLDHELESPTGWRPNDLFLWGPTLWADNNANRQLGIIQALRESVRVFRDHLTKVSATEYDANLVDADTKLRNDEFKFWFPSAEGRFGEGADALRAYARGLSDQPPTSKPLNRRNVELIRLFQAWTDLLGGAHANLYREEASFWDTDDYFYHAQGFAHVMVHMTRAVRREYEAELRERATVLELLDQITHSLSVAATMKPLVVLDGSAAGILRQLMYSVREELEK